MDDIIATVDFREFLRAVDQYARETGKSGADSLNRAMEWVIYRGRNSVYRHTPKTTKGRIKRDLKARHPMLARIATKNLKRKGRPVTRDSIVKEMTREANRRYSSIGYIKAGWQPAGAVFGATRLRPPRPGTVAAKGRARRATERKLEAYALNAVGAELDSGEIRTETYATVQKSVNAQTENMLRYLAKRLEDQNRRHGGR